VLKDRAGIDNPIEVGDRQAYGSAVDRPQVARAGGAVQIDRVVDTAIAGRQHHWRTVPDQCQMADQAASSTAYRSARSVRPLSRWRVSVLRGVLDRLTVSSMQEQARNNEPNY
jgi:hypothetical protein